MPAWANYPKPSPTSRLGINVRFYHVAPKGCASRVWWDIGEEMERILETSVWEARKVPSLDVHEYEKLIRSLVERRFDRVVSFHSSHVLYTICYQDFDSEGRVQKAYAQEALHMAKETLKGMEETMNEETPPPVAVEAQPAPTPPEPTGSGVDFIKSIMSPEEFKKFFGGQ